MSDRAPFSYGKQATTQERYDKVLLMGKHSTGKTTWWCEAAARYKDKTVIALSTEPSENLMRILDTFPEVKNRTRILPDEEQQKWIDARATDLDARGYKGKEVALSEFIINYVFDLSKQPESELRKLFVVLDTGSYVKKRLGRYVQDAMGMKDLSVVEDPNKGQMNYAPFYDKFNVMMERLMKMPCHTIVTARVEPEGKMMLNEKNKMAYTETGNEQAEWGSDDNLRVHLWYDATTVVHLFSAKVKSKDENNTDIKIILPDGKIEYQMEIRRWARLEKWKANTSVQPTFYDISPEAIFAWIEKHNPTL